MNSAPDANINRQLKMDLYHNLQRDARGTLYEVQLLLDTFYKIIAAYRKSALAASVGGRNCAHSKPMANTNAPLQMKLRPSIFECGPAVKQSGHKPIENHTYY